MYLANSTFKHTLSWDEPFSWHEFPIISYVINITNYPYGQVTSVLKLIDSLNSLYSPQKFSFTSDGDYCYNLEVSLVASNIVGDSMPRTFHTGHPIGKLMPSLFTIKWLCTRNSYR